MVSFVIYSITVWHIFYLLFLLIIRHNTLFFLKMSKKQCGMKDLHCLLSACSAFEKKSLSVFISMGRDVCFFCDEFRFLPTFRCFVLYHWHCISSVSLRRFFKSFFWRKSNNFNYVKLFLWLVNLISAKDLLSLIFLRDISVLARFLTQRNYSSRK